MDTNDDDKQPHERPTEYHVLDLNLFLFFVRERAFVWAFFPYLFAAINVTWTIHATVRSRTHTQPCQEV